MGVLDTFKILAGEVLSTFGTKYNALIEKIPVSGAMVQNGLLRLLTNDGSQINIAIPKVPNSVLAGCELSVVDTTAVIQPGEWQIDAVTYQKLSQTNLTIDAIVNPVNTRIDVVYATTANTFLLKKGLEATVPGEPTLAANELKIGIVVTTSAGSGVPDDEGGEGIFKPVGSTLAFPVANLSGKDYWIINAGGIIFYLKNDSSLAIDNISVFAAASGGRWIANSSGGGAVKLIALKWAVADEDQRIYNLSDAIVLNGVTGTLPDMGPTSVITVDDGASLFQSDHYSVAARTITLAGAQPVTEPFIYCVYAVPAAGEVVTPGGGPSNTVSTQPGSQILITETTNLDGSKNYDLEADPKLVTNQVNAVTPALVDTIMLGNNTAGSQIKSSGIAIIGPIFVSVPASNASAGISGQRARNTTNGNEYSYSHGQWWWDNAPTSGERKTFTT